VRALRSPDEARKLFTPAHACGVVLPRELTFFRSIVFVVLDGLLGLIRRRRQSAQKAMSFAAFVDSGDSYQVSVYGSETKNCA
jgi:hypothetical protein